MIYLDHHAAAPTPPLVREAMAEAASAAWANPSSPHRAGRRARRWLEQAREQVASAIGADPVNLVFTGGGTEACNLGIRGLARTGDLLVSTSVEHPAVAESIQRLGRRGHEVRTLSVVDGEPPPLEALVPHLGSGALLAVQWVNHETGTIFPIAEYARLCAEHGARLFVDATQALGKVAIDVTSLGADVVAFAAQKVGGPAGAGACWVRRGASLRHVLEGGSQERGRRPGTPDTLNMVGFGAAASMSAERLALQPRIARLRNRFEARLVELGAVVNAPRCRTATVSNVSFRGWSGPVLVAALDLEGVCASTGAACSSGLQEPSAVLRAMYPDEQWRAGSAVRISLGIETSETDMDQAFQVFRLVLARSAA